jgi:hypothetical protein
LTGRKFDLTTPDLRGNILQFYSDLSAPIDTKKDKDRWQDVLTSLDQLKLVTPAPAVAGATAATTSKGLRLLSSAKDPGVKDKPAPMAPPTE